MAHVGLTPNGLTLIGFGIAASPPSPRPPSLAVGCTIFSAGSSTCSMAWSPARPARSAPGAFMDSIFDRWGEASSTWSIAWGGVLAWRGRVVAILATAALGAAFMVSYTRAKSEGFLSSPAYGMAAIGVMPREIRLIVLSRASASSSPVRRATTVKVEAPT